MFYGTQIALFLQLNPQQYTLLSTSKKNLEFYYCGSYQYIVKLFTFLLL